MNNNLEQFNTQAVPKAVLKNAIPSMAAMILILLYNMADSFFIAQTGDSVQIAAVSIAAPMFFILLSIGNIFGIGGMSYLSRSLGKGDKSLAKKISSFCFWGCIGIGIMVASVIFFKLDVVIQNLGATDDTFSMVKSYLQILCIASPFMVISPCLSNLLRGEGQAIKAINGMLLGNLINIVLNAIFIFGFNLGVEGVAIATVIGNVCGSLYYLLYVQKGNTILSINIKDFAINNGILFQVLLIGVPASVAMILMSIAPMFLSYQMAQYGDMPLAVLAAVIQVTMIISMIFIGFGQGVQPLLGYAVGAKDQKRYKEIIKFSIGFTFTLGIVLTTISYLNLNQIVGASFYNNELADQNIYTFVPMVVVLSSFLLGMLYILLNALQATGSVIAALVVNISRQGLIYIPMIFILNDHFGMNGLFFVQPIADITTFLLAIILYVIVSKKVFS
ncbi:MAG: MATE family efflux transporter [Clostridia bacterium]